VAARSLFTWRKIGVRTQIACKRVIAGIAGILCVGAESYSEEEPSP
jgi:hypothetical protein